MYSERPRHLQGVFLLFDRKGQLFHIRRRGWHDNPDVDITQLPVDLDGSSLFALGTILATADKNVLGRIEGSPLFPETVEDNLHRYLQRLDEKLEWQRFSTTGCRFLLQFRHQLNEALLQNINYDASELMLRCLPKGNTTHAFEDFSLFQILFPKTAEVFSTEISVKQGQRIINRGILRSSAWNQALKDNVEKLDQNTTFSIGDIVYQMLKIQEQLLVSSETHIHPFSLEQIFAEAIKLKQAIDPTFLQDPRASKDPYTSDQLLHYYQQKYELAIIQNDANEILLLRYGIQQLDLTRFKEQNNRPRIDHVEKMLQDPDLLVNPEDYGLIMDVPRTLLLRSHFEDTHLDPDMRYSENEKRILYKRIFVISPDSIRQNPNGFYEYQRALVIKIAHRLGIPLNKQISIPFPDELRSKKSKQVFRAQEQHIKSYNDWHWLLLYEDVQELFFANLPYCAIPPISSCRFEDRQDIFFSWAIPQEIRNSGAIVHTDNQLLPFYHWDEEKKKLVFTLPGQFNLNVLRAGGIPVIIHGLSRDLFAGNRWDDLSSAMYLYTTTQVPLDVDEFVLRRKGSHRFDLGVIAQQVVKKLPTAHGVDYESRHGRSLQGRRFVFMYKVLADGRFAMFLNAFHSFMGRVGNQETSLLLLNTLATVDARSFGFLLEKHSFNGQDALLAKPVDIHGGLGAYMNGKISAPSLEDAFPSDTYGIWMLMRTLPDTARIGATLDWKQFRETALRLCKLWVIDWNHGETVHPDIKKDLAEEARKALMLAFNINPRITWTMLTGSNRHEFEQVQGIGLAFFFPNLITLMRSPIVWNTVHNLLNVEYADGKLSGADYLLYAVHEAVHERQRALQPKQRDAAEEKEYTLLSKIVKMSTQSLLDWLCTSTFELPTNPTHK